MHIDIVTDPLVEQISHPEVGATKLNIMSINLELQMISVIISMYDFRIINQNLNLFNKN